MMQWTYKQMSTKIHPDKRSTDDETKRKATHEQQRLNTAKALLEGWYKAAGNKGYVGWESDEYKRRPSAQPKSRATPAGLHGRKPSDFSMPSKATVRPRVERGTGQSGASKKHKVDLQPVGTTLASTSTAVMPAASSIVAA